MASALGWARVLLLAGASAVAVTLTVDGLAVAAARRPGPHNHRALGHARRARSWRGWRSGTS